MEQNKLFRFKRFSLVQENTALRIGTDAVLLGCSVDFGAFSGGLRILDIGCGCGIILLMLAQKAIDAGFEEIYLKGIDIDAGSISDARTNADLFRSAFHCSGKVVIDFEQVSLQDFVASQRPAASNGTAPANYTFDIIVSNPPFFINSLKNANESDRLARHNDSLSQRELVEGVGRLLSAGGVFKVILPSAESELFKAECANGTVFGECGGSLKLESVLKIRTIAAKEPKRQILSFTKGCAAVTRESELVMMKSNTNGRGPATTSNKKEAFTAEYLSFTQDFLIF